MAKAIHMMIRVLDEQRSVDFYARAFDLAIADRFVFDGFTLIYLRNPASRFRGRADRQSRPHRALHARHRLWPYRLRRRQSRSRARPDEGGRRGSRRHQGIPPRRRADGKILLRAGPRRLQDRGSSETWPVPLSSGPAHIGADGSAGPALSLGRNENAGCRQTNETLPPRLFERERRGHRRPGRALGRRRHDRQPRRRLGDVGEKPQARDHADADPDGAGHLSARPSGRQILRARRRLL